MRNYLKYFSVTLLFFALFIMGCATEWEKLDKKVKRLRKNGNYAEAIKITKNALIASEKKSAKREYEAAIYYLTLSFLYYDKGDYKRGEMFSKRFTQLGKYFDERLPGACPGVREEDIIKGKTGLILKITIFVLSLCIFLGVFYVLFEVLAPYKKSDLEFLITNVNFLDNTLDKFQVNYKEWLNGGKFKNIDFIDSLAFKLKDKRLKKYISRNVYVRIEDFLNILVKFNQNKEEIEIYKDKEKKEYILELAKTIHDYCQRIKAKVINV